jgi:hypothetical protein
MHLRWVPIITVLFTSQAFGLWDFNSGTPEGWVFGGNPASAMAINAAGELPEPGDGTWGLYLPDGGYATYQLSSPMNSFRFSADVAAGAPTINLFKAAGLGYRYAYDADTVNPRSLSPATAVDAWFEGKSSGGPKIGFKDTYNGAGSSGGDWVDPVGGLGSYIVSMTLVIDFNYSVPGEILIGAAPLDHNYAGSDPVLPNMISAGPAPYNDALGDYEPINMLRLGGAYSWSQFYVDNVDIPEPTVALMLLLAAPLMLRRR